MKQMKRLLSLVLAGTLLLSIPGMAWAGTQSDADSLAGIYNDETSPMASYNTDQAAPYDAFFQNRDEIVHTGNGGLTISETDLVLPGRAGLDLRLTRYYVSQSASLYRMSAWVNSESTTVDQPAKDYWLPILKPAHTTYTFNPAAVCSVIEGCDVQDYESSTSPNYLVFDEYNVPDYYIKSVTDWSTIGSKHVDEGGYYSDKASETYHEDWWTADFVPVPAHTETHVDYWVEDSMKTDTHLDARNGLGVGWQWGFPTLEINGSSITYHEAGSAMLVDLAKANGFKDYPVKDQVFSKDTSSPRFTNGQQSSSYKLTTKDGRVTFFGSDGRLLGIKDRFGNTITFEHTLLNNKPVISKITDSVGRFVTFAYTATQVTVTAPGNRVWTYRLDPLSVAGKQKLTAVVDPLGRTTQYEYEEQPATFSFVERDPAKHKYKTTYLNLIGEIYPTEGASRYAYQKVMDNLGKEGTRDLFKVQSRFDLVNGTEQNRADYEYSGEPGGYPAVPSSLQDSYQYSSTVTRADSTTVTVTYDKRHLPIRKETKGAGIDEVVETTYDPTYKTPTEEKTTYSPNSATPRVTISTTKFDEYRDLVEKVDVLGAKTTITYDPKFHQVRSVITQQDSGRELRTTYEIDSTKGVVMSEAKSYMDGIVPRTITETYEYDQYGNRIKVTKPWGSATTVIRFEYGSAYKSAYLTKRIEFYTDVEGVVREATSSFAYDFNTGRLTNYTDPIGAMTTAQYDALGRPKVLVHPPVEGVAHTRLFEYRDAELQTVVTDENNHSAQYEYDQLGRLSKVKRTLETIQYTVSERGYDRVGRLKYEYDAKRLLTSYEYDGVGRVTLVTFPDLTTKTTTYDDLTPSVTETDANGNSVTKIKDAAGRTIETRVKPDKNRTEVYVVTTTYDYAGNVLSTTDARGAQTRFGYDELNRRRFMTDAENNTYRYFYDPDGDITAEEGPLGRTTRYTYDPTGRLLTVTNPEGGVVTNGYDAKGRKVLRIDERNNRTTYEYDARDRLRLEVDSKHNETRYVYDPVGNLTARTDARGNTSTVEYDEWNRVKKAANAYGEGFEYEYDLNGNRIRQEDSLGYYVEYMYDARNRLTETKRLSKIGTPNEYVIETIEYDLVGNRKKVTDGLNHVTSYAYDGLNRVLQVDRFLGTTTVSETTEYDEASNIIATADARGKITRFSYNKLNHLTSVTDPLLNVWTYQRDPYGNALVVTNPRNAIVRFDYDGMNRKRAVIDALGNATYTTYDKAGNIIQFGGEPIQQIISDPMSDDSDADGRATGWSSTSWTNTDDTAVVTTTMEDGGQKVTLSAHAAGGDGQYYDYTAAMFRGGTNSMTTWAAKSADAFKVSIDYRQSGGDYTQFAIVYYDASKRVIGIEYSEPLNPATSWERQEFQAKPAPTGTTYAGIMLLFRTSNATNPTTLNGSAWFRNLRVEKGENRGNRSFAYDALNRVTSIIADGVSISYQYDEVGNRIEMTDQLGTTRYHYDNANRLWQVITPNEKSAQYDYNSLGLVDTLTDYAGNKTSFSYDPLRRVTTATWNGSRVATFTYDALGHRTGVSLANGITTSYRFDDLQRLEGLSTTNSVGQTVTSIGYGYDETGNMTAKTENGQTTTYQYSDRNQLTRVTRPDGSYIEYQYDPAGNRERMFQSATGAATTYSYDAANRLLARTAPEGRFDYTWDKYGNQLSDGINQYEYDSLNRLVTVKTPTKQVSYQYNGDNLVVARSVGTASTRFYHVGQYVLNESDAGGNMTASMVRGGGTNLARVTGANSQQYYLYNGHGDVVTMADAAGVTKATYAYDEFGNLTAQTGAADNPYLYAGEYYDADAYLYYLRTRFYSPLTGRFLTEDTYQGRMNDPLSLNLYTYVRSNPLTFVDPSGLAEMVVIMVHGIWGDGTIWNDLISKYLSADQDHKYFDAGTIRLDANGNIIVAKPEDLETLWKSIKDAPDRAVVRVEYTDKDAPLDKDTKFLAALISLMAKDAKVPTFALVGHSAGGLISRSYLQTLYKQREGDFTVSHLITLDSPHLGSSLPNGLNGVGYAGPLGRLIKWGATTISPMLKDLMVGSDFINRLNSGELPQDVKVLLIGGSTDMVVPSLNSQLSLDSEGRSTIKWEKSGENGGGKDYLNTVFNPVVRATYTADHTGDGAIYDHPPALETVMRFLDATTTYGFEPTPELKPEQ